MEMVINMDSVQLGETENHLLFKGYVPTLNNFYRYKFDFTGVDLVSTSGLSEKQLKRLRNKLREDYGNPPFKVDSAKEKLGDGKQYRIEA